MLVYQLVDRYTEARKQSLSQSAVVFLRALSKAVRSLGEVDDISPREWRDIRDSWVHGGWEIERPIRRTSNWHLLTQKKKDELTKARKSISKGWSIHSIARGIAALRKILRWGACEGLCLRESYDNISLVPGNLEDIPNVVVYPKVSTVSWEDVEAIKPLCNELIWDMIQVQWHTGMRSNEVMQLNSKEIERQGDVWLYRPSKHKTARLGKDKLIAIGPAAIEILRKYWKTGYFFPWRDTHHQTKHYERYIRRAVLRAGCTYWSPHQLRHSRADIVRQKFGLEAAAAVLGNTISAAQIYAERNQQLAIETARTG